MQLKELYFPKLICDDAIPFMIMFARFYFFINLYK